MAEQRGERRVQPPEKIERAQRDMDDLQRLIRYVERWRMAHFQRPDEVRAGMGEDMAGDPTAIRGPARRRSADRRLSDADEVLQKLRSGLQTAAGEAMAGPQSRRPAYQQLGI